MIDLMTGRELPEIAMMGDTYKPDTFPYEVSTAGSRFDVEAEEPRCLPEEGPSMNPPPWMGRMTPEMLDDGVENHFDDAERMNAEFYASGVPRSSEWEAFEKKIIAAHPRCAACGGGKRLQVHHLVPFSWDKSLELVESNVMVLCQDRSCHLRVGHCNNWLARNPHAKADAERELKMLDGIERKP